MTTVTGTNDSDKISGTKADDVIYGGAGDDFLQGRAGGDFLEGGAGDDQLQGNEGDDYLRGGAGNDFLHGGLGADTAVYSGSILDYSFSRDGENFFVSHGGGNQADGNDRLISVERLVFADAAIGLGQNNAPVAFNDSAATNEDVGTYSGSSVLANDFDWEKNSLTAVPGTFNGAYGTLVLNADGTYTYTPDGSTQALALGQSVQDSFTYVVSDGSLSDTGTLTITIAGRNDAPVADPDAASTGENQALLIAVLANDSDPDNGAVLSIASASAPAGKGSVSIVGNQLAFETGTDFDYLAAGENASVTIAYTVADEHGATASSTAIVTVTGTNDAPAVDAAGTVASGSVTELPDGDPGENSAILSADGVVAFDDLDLSDTHSASFAAQGADYLGTFTLDPVDQAGDTVSWHFDVDDAVLDSLAPGETLTQTYTVQVSDGHGGTATQDVTVTITGTDDPAGPPWYIDNSAAGSTNAGTAANPFTSIAAFNAAQGTDGGPQAGELVYLLNGTGTYAEADGINLLDGQSLVGIGQPVIIASAGDGVNVARNNTLSGFGIGDTAGAGIADSGGSVGTLTVSGVSISGEGQIVDIDQGGTLSVTLTSAASTGSAGGAIDLTGVSGSFTVSGATTITGTHSGGGIDITGSSGLTAGFGGGLTVSTGNTNAVSFTGNVESTLSITGGGLDIDTTSGTGLLVENGGSVSISGAGNSIASVTGSAVVIRDANSAGVTLESVSSNGGTESGIILDNAGFGGFSVTGTASVSGSGGTIVGKTGADGTDAQGSGISISNTANVALANMTISGNANGGIVGSNAAGFALTDSTLTNNGSSASEGALSFTDLTGTVALLGNVIAGSSGDNVSVVNSAGTLHLTIADSARDEAVIGTVNSAIGGDGIHIATAGGADLTLRVEGVEFQGAREDLLDVTASGSSSQDLSILGNVFDNNQANVGGGGGLSLGGTGSGIDVSFTVEDNSFTGAAGSAITALYGQQSGTVRGNIEGNTIGTADGAATAEGSSGGGMGIFAALDKAAGAGDASFTLSIADNQIHDIASGVAGIYLRANGGTADGQAVLEATVTGNVVDEMGDFTFAALYALAGGNGPGDSAALGLHLEGNAFDLSDADFASNAVYLDQASDDAHFYFPGYGGSGTGEYLGGTASADLHAFWTPGNAFSNGGAASFPGGVDAGVISGATGEAFHYPVWP